jgi:hypothetical protein
MIETWGWWLPCRLERLRACVGSPAGAAIGVTLSLDEAITLRPPTPPEPKLTPGDLIAPRPPAPAGPPGLAASHEFREDIALVVHAIAEQYIKVCGCTGCGSTLCVQGLRARICVLHGECVACFFSGDVE